jgi:hypothetical protein
LAAKVAYAKLQIGFLTEWQMYAQQIEGDYWRGGKLDKGKVDKMSGIYFRVASEVGSPES